MTKNIEGTGDKFNIKTYMEARKMVQKIVLLTASQFDVGMTEAQGSQIIDELCENFKVEKKWHPNKFRIGSNTTKAFREKSDPDVVLKENDIYFIDVGLVINGHEADYGQTFTVGQNLEFAHAQKTSREIFNELKTLWKETNITGKALYEAGEKIAKDKGYILNPAMDGHRLGDFPHGAFYKGSLSEFDKMPIENLWVLEVLIKHPDKDFGAFYEDILV